MGAVVVAIPKSFGIVTVLHCVVRRKHVPRPPLLSRKIFKKEIGPTNQIAALEPSWRSLFETESNTLRLNPLAMAARKTKHTRDFSESDWGAVREFKPISVSQLCEIRKGITEFVVTLDSTKKLVKVPFTHAIYQADEDDLRILATLTT